MATDKLFKGIAILHEKPHGWGECRTCEHSGCCVDLPYCGGLRWESAWDDEEEEEETEEEEEKEINDD